MQSNKLQACCDYHAAPSCQASLPSYGKLADVGIPSDLSRCEFDMRNFPGMEARILYALSWNHHPPTPIAVASTLFPSFFCSTDMLHVPMNDFDDICDVSSFFCELGVCDYFFVPLGASRIALATILNALEGMVGPDNKQIG
jgi:hypothetical protein